MTGLSIQMYQAAHCFSAQVSWEKSVPSYSVVNAALAVELNISIQKLLWRAKEVGQKREAEGRREMREGVRN